VSVDRRVERGLPVGDEGSVVTLGTFDGVHRGHQDVLERLHRRAEVTGRPSIVVTFDPHPLQVVNPAAAPALLTTLAERLEWFVQTGVRYVVVLPFTPSLAAMDAEQFVDDILRARFRMTELLVGHDHGFGRGRMGDTTALTALGASRGFAVQVLEPIVGTDGTPVSSSAIRRHVSAGDMARAAVALGRHYSVSGRVVGGERRGRMLGFRTLNLDPPPSPKLLPPDGVYAVRVQTPGGQQIGMLNLGPRPTFSEMARRLEAHVFDAEQDWYGAHVRIDFVERLRDVRAFPDGAALAAQLADDEQQARSILQRQY
jgi:riboflavin kinase/FMN adenylyltransferase